MIDRDPTRDALEQLVRDFAEDLDCGSYAERHRAGMLDSATCAAIGVDLRMLLERAADPGVGGGSSSQKTDKEPAR